jgi:hypothetical protein
MPIPVNPVPIKCRPHATRLFPPERAALRKPSLATGRLAEHRGAAGADDDGLSVRENGRDREAAGALDVHEERAGALDESLELVLRRLRGGKRVEKVNGENLRRRVPSASRLGGRNSMSSLFCRRRRRSSSRVGQTGRVRHDD